MRRVLFKLLAVLAVWTVSVDVSRADDLKLIGFWENTKQRVMGSLMRCDYETLQKMAEEMRSNKLKMISGGWQIDAFYAGVETVAPRQGEDQNDPIMRKCFAKWTAAYPNSPTPVITFAEFLNDSAWLIRGTGFAQEVWPEQWDRFGKLLNEARDVLIRSKDFAADDPRWYSLMVLIMKASGDDKDAILKIAREGIGKQPSYLKTYLETMGAMLPQWGGSAKAMDDWAKESVALSEKSDGQALYARVYWYANSLLSREDMALLPIDWARVSRGTDDIISAYPNAGNIEQSVKFSCRSRDPDEVRKRYRRMAELAGPALKQDIVPAKYCRWASDPETFPGSAMRQVGDPKKVSAP